MIGAELHGRAVLVTGGGSGIGLAAARRFLASGAVVLVNDLAAEKEAAVRALAEAAEMPREAARNLHFVAADAADPETPARLVAEAAARFGGLDILVNNAATPGTAEPIPVADLDALDDAFWHKLLEVNLVAPFRMTRAAATALKARRGAVVNTASIAGLGGQASSIPYAASKAGLVNLTRNLARALAPEVRVNAVAPGLIDTPWTRGWPAERRRASVDNTLLKTIGQPDDIAEAILFLAAGARFMTGQTVVADGGRGL